MESRDEGRHGVREEEGGIMMKWNKCVLGKGV